jgi:transketolase C-terminal domain/subunit
MKALRDVFGDTLVSLGSSDPNVVVLDADLANSTKADSSPRCIRTDFCRWELRSKTLSA